VPPVNSWHHQHQPCVKLAQMGNMDRLLMRTLPFATIAASASIPPKQDALLMLNV
jgi:hypothetical protein